MPCQPLLAQTCCKLVALHVLQNDGLHACCQVFVSNSERLRLKELAHVLGKDLDVIQQAMSNALRMGFAVLMDGARSASCSIVRASAVPTS